jgi:hypothetical protein
MLSYVCLFYKDKNASLDDLQTRQLQNPKGFWGAENISISHKQCMEE